MIGLQLEPVDTWFFRDGTPFTMGEAPQENVGSLFPPHPPTVVGALRAALALGNGWSGRGPWSRDLCDVLGDGPDTLGTISLDGPFLLRDGEPLFRVPRHVVGAAIDAGWAPSALLRPGALVACDLGERPFPEVVGDNRRRDEAADKLETGADYWLTPAGLGAVLHGRVPPGSTVISGRRLWSDEPRIGLERDVATHTAQEGRLYSTRHVRLERGVALGVRLSGLPDNWDPPFGRLLPLGGESRLASSREWRSDVRFDSPRDEIAERAALIALSPVDLDEDALFGRRTLDTPVGYRVVSACLDRPQRVGGWDSLMRRPLPTRSVLPPGSVLFCERSTRDQIEEESDGMVRVGRRQEWGFGLAAIGVWPE